MAIIKLHNGREISTDYDPKECAALWWGRLRRFRAGEDIGVFGGQWSRDEQGEYILKRLKKIREYAANGS